MSRLLCSASKSESITLKKKPLSRLRRATLSRPPLQPLKPCLIMARLRKSKKKRRRRKRNQLSDRIILLARAKRITSTAESRTNNMKELYELTSQFVEIEKRLSDIRGCL